MSSGGLRARRDAGYRGTRMATYHRYERRIPALEWAVLIVTSRYVRFRELRLARTRAR